MTTANRGKVTDAIKATAKKLLDIDDITTTEFRLMPYLQYVMVNEQRIDTRKINEADREAIAKFKEMGFIKGGFVTKITVTKKFWNAMHELIWKGYVTNE